MAVSHPFLLIVELLMVGVCSRICLERVSGMTKNI